jgi:hypothetical protein
MHWCGKSCMTLIWDTDHYTNAAAPGNFIMTVEKFTRDSVVLHRTDFKVPGTAVLTGKLSPQGDSIVDGTLTWTYHPCCKLNTFPFTAAWGAAIGTVPGSDEERDRPAAAEQARVCGSPSIRVAMQTLAERSMHDPSGQGMRLLGLLAMGADLQVDAPQIRDSQVAVNHADLAKGDPGAFVCVGLFAQGELHARVNPDADATASLAVALTQAVMATHPPAFMWFKVKPLDATRYRLLLVPIGTQLTLKYSTDFTLAAR